MRCHGWILLFHDCIVEQLQKLHAAAERARRNDPDGYHGNANVKLFRALTHAILEAVPGDPGRDEYRQGNTLGPAHRHWRRARIGRRFRLFFRYDSRSRTIVFAWVNDAQTLRSSGSRSEPYAVFEKMLRRGNPPDDWGRLVAEVRGSGLESCIGARFALTCVNGPSAPLRIEFEGALYHVMARGNSRDGSFPDDEDRMSYSIGSRRKIGCNYPRGEVVYRLHLSYA